MIILDTDIVTLLHADHPTVVGKLEASKDEKPAVTVITFVEIMRGRFEYLLKASTKSQFLHAQRLLQGSAKKLQALPIIYLDDAALDFFESLRGRKGLKNVSRADVLIASIAVAQRATLVTRNLKHFKLIPHLACENWVD